MTSIGSFQYIDLKLCRGSCFQQPAGDGAKKYRAKRMRQTITRAVPEENREKRQSNKQENEKSVKDIEAKADCVLWGFSPDEMLNVLSHKTTVMYVFLNEY